MRNRTRSRSRSRKNCITRSQLSLKTEQKKVVKYLLTHDHLLVVHGTGCGKTLSAVTASQCYLDMYPKNKVVFVGPASLLSNFKKELNAYGNVYHKKRYELYSFHAFMNALKKGKPVACKNTFLIIDEVHNLRNLKTKMYQSVIKCSMKANKRMLLTATPYVNNVYDFAGLINLLHGENLLGFRFRQNIVDYDYYLSSKNFTTKNIQLIIKFLKGHVDYIKSCNSGKFYPKVQERFFEIPMSKEYFLEYEKAEKFYPKAHRFYHGYRKAVNEAGKGYYSQKLEHIIPLLNKQKSVIYTNWLVHGVKIIKKLLVEKGITFSVFQGSLTKKKNDS